MRIFEMKGTARVLLTSLYILARGQITMVQHDLVVHEVLEVLLAQRVLLEVKIECGHRVGCRLVLRIMQLLEVGMLQSLLHRDSVIGIVREHLLQQVDGIRISALEQLLEVAALALRQLLYEILVLLVFDLIDELLTRVAQ